MQLDKNRNPDSGYCDLEKSNECAVKIDKPAEEETTGFPRVTLEPYSFKYGGASERGPRFKNDDYFKIDPEDSFIAVSDGVGGAPYGDVMSRIGCNVSTEAFRANDNLIQSFNDANERAYQVTRWLDCLESGTAATLLLARFEYINHAGSKLAIVNAGDTAAFLLRNSSLEQLTKLDRYKTTNHITSAIGLQETIIPKVVELEVFKGDRLLFCTDGVWSQVEKEKLKELLKEGDSATRIAPLIVEEAVRQGNDNATAVVVLVV